MLNQLRLHGGELPLGVHTQMSLNVSHHVVSPACLILAPGVLSPSSVGEMMAYFKRAEFWHRTGARFAGNPHVACEVEGAGNGDMVGTEAPARGESRRQQLLPLPTSTAPALDPTEVYEEHNVVRHQPALSPHFRSEEICRREDDGCAIFSCLLPFQLVPPKVGHRGAGR